MNTVSYIFTSSPSCEITKRNVNIVTLISKKDRARVVNTLFKVKFQLSSYNVQLYLKRNFPDTFFSGNFQNNFSSSFCEQQVL